jgi:hypothetical protein
MMDIVKMPAAPTPVTARPTRKLGKVGAIDVISAPAANMMLAMNIQKRGENIDERRPASGVVLDIAI